LRFSIPPFPFYDFGRGIEKLIEFELLIMLNACLALIPCSICSSIEEVVAKYAQLTPQERAKR
jgi:hypothetical protein